MITVRDFQTLVTDRFYLCDSRATNKLDLRAGILGILARNLHTKSCQNELKNIIYEQIHEYQRNYASCTQHSQHIFKLRSGNLEQFITAIGVFCSK